MGRFREYADVLFEKRGMDEVMSALDDELLRDSELDREDEEIRRDWAEVHWRPPHARATEAAEGGERESADDEGGGVRRPEERNERAGLGTGA